MSNQLAQRMATLGALLRETPVLPLKCEGIHLYAKLEGHNPIGSVKDRPAYWLLKSAFERGQLDSRSTIIESSSGNFANALAAYCRLVGLKFIPVIDPNIAPGYESVLHRLCDRVVKVQERDDTGGFLKTRLAKVKELVDSTPGAYWTNQYGNPDALQAHYRLTGEEIARAFTKLDYVFVGVSTGGTISGVSNRLKEKFPSVKIIAVDAEGSVIFGGAPRKRHIPGIGASIVPDLVKQARIDEVVRIPESETAHACQELLRCHGLFVGGSSGSAYAAVKRYLPQMRSLTPPNVLFLCADGGAAYLETLYNPEWTSRLE